MLQRRYDTGAEIDLVLGGAPLTVADAHAVGHRRRRVTLTEDPVTLDKVRAAAALVEDAVERGERVYGVTTGFGSMAEVAIPRELAARSQANLLSFLAAGAGRDVDRRHVRAAMALRANMLLRGNSGVRIDIVERLIRWLDVDAIPVVRELGSIGASGDLIPLGTIARAVTGQGGDCRVQWRDREVSSSEVLAELGLEPLELLPKEALAVVNGTTFSAAIAANCVHEAKNLLGLTLAIEVMMVRALRGHQEPFHRFVHECKPHPGQLWTASVIRRALENDVSLPADNGAGNGADNRAGDHLQDRYAIRCLPQYFGPLVEGLARVETAVSTEMNAVSDNPLIDTEREHFFQSGNFLGQYVGLGMDDLRRYLGLMAKHVDVEIAQLVAPEFNLGLPPSLTGNQGLSYNMGLKGLQIAGNSIMPLLTYFGHPLVEHFPTHAEQYNQNVNSLSWGAAHLAWQSVELYQQYAAVALLFAVQAVDLRAHALYEHYDGRALLGSFVEPLYSAAYAALGRQPGETAPLVWNDASQSLEEYLAKLAANIADEDSLVTAISPLLDMFDEARLGC